MNAHACHAVGCRVLVPPRVLMCRAHRSLTAPVAGFPAYRVGVDGRLWSQHAPGGKGFGEWREAANKIRSGNLYVEDVLCSGERHAQVRRHVIVLEAFRGPRPTGLEARHLNDVKSDNRLDNLVWGTRGENMADRRVNGIVPVGALAGLVPEILELRSQGLTVRAIAARVGLSFGWVSAAIRRRLGPQPRGRAARATNQQHRDEWQQLKAIRLPGDGEVARMWNELEKGE